MVWVPLPLPVTDYFKNDKSSAFQLFVSHILLLRLNWFRLTTAHFINRGSGLHYNYEWKKSEGKTRIRCYYLSKCCWTNRKNVLAVLNYQSFQKIKFLSFSLIILICNQKKLPTEISHKTAANWMHRQTAINVAWQQKLRAVGIYKVDYFRDKRFSEPKN